MGACSAPSSLGKLRPEVSPESGPGSHFAFLRPALPPAVDRSGSCPGESGVLSAAPSAHAASEPVRASDRRPHPPGGGLRPPTARTEGRQSPGSLCPGVSSPGATRLLPARCTYDRNSSPLGTFKESADPPLTDLSAEHSAPGAPGAGVWSAAPLPPLCTKASPLLFPAQARGSGSWRRVTALPWTAFGALHQPGP